MYQSSKSRFDRDYDRFLDAIHHDPDDLGEFIFWDFADRDEKQCEFETGEKSESAYRWAFRELYEFDEEGLKRDIAKTARDYVTYQEELAKETAAKRNREGTS